MRNASVLVLALGLLATLHAAPAAAQAPSFPACVTTAQPGQIPAARIYSLDSNAQVWAKFCGGTAGYTSDTYVQGDPNPVYIGTGNVTPSGTIVDLGLFTSGSELVFFIYVRNTGYTYYTGPGSRNPDGIVHAAIEDLGNGFWRIGFEDLYGGGDKDYDDINLLIYADAIIAPPCDGQGDDVDDDGICGYDDNCLDVANTDQADADGDGFGDACDACPFDADNDADADGVCGDVDNCPSDANADQADTDADGAGDACDACPYDADNDSDADGLCADEDNCVEIYNPEQTDLDNDGIGDLCDDCVDVDEDGVCDDADRCEGTTLPDDVPTVRLGTNRFADIDGDGVFDTVSPNGKGPGRAYTIAMTGGCSCAQIIEALGLGEGHSKFGCSISAMDDWIGLAE
jgi:hypothetical protein